MPDHPGAGDAPGAEGRVEELASGRLLLDEPAAGVARLTIANEARRNALDHELLDALAEAIAPLDARCLVLTGRGSTFCAGYDLGDLHDDAQLAERAERLVAHPFHAAIEALERYPYPTIAAINGHAIGGGLELAVACDLRLAARGARVGMPPARLGLVYSHTGIKRFMDACGPAHTSEIFFTGRNLGAARAAEIGLVNHVVDSGRLAGRALALAGEIAANSPLSLAGNKRVMAALRADAAELPEDIAEELVRLREACFASEDFREGVRAFAEKRPPAWTGR